MLQHYSGKIHGPACHFPSLPYIRSILKRGLLAALYLSSLLLLLPEEFYRRPSPAAASPAAAEETASFVGRITGEILRLHILADSDSVSDQEIKLHVRDAVLARVQPLLSGASSAADSEERLLSALPELLQYVNDELETLGAGYSATLSLSTEFFPIRRYGSVLLPPGRYRALRIVLGRGGGHNWWCMLYPSLCFTEGITGTVSCSEKEKLETALCEEDYTLLFSDGEKPEFTFRFLRLFRLFQRRHHR